MKRFLPLIFLLLPLSALAQTNTAAGNLTAQSASCLATNCVSLRFYPNTINATITLSGTWSATVQFEVSGDFGITWVAAPTASSTSNGTTQFQNVGGYTNMRARVSTFVSGTVNTTIVGSTQSVTTSTIINNGGAGVSAAILNNNDWFVSPNCNGAANCTQIHADLKTVKDATSTSTTTISCPNSDCNFTAADVGKTIWATTVGAGFNAGIYTTYVCPVTTISTVVSAQSVTVGTACTASGAGNVALYWGTKDGTALAGINALLSTTTCQTIHLPSGSILVDKPFLLSNPSPCNPSLVGAGGLSTTILFLSPDFNWAGCTGAGGTNGGVCIGSGVSWISNINILGTGLTSASNSNCANGANKVVLAGNNSYSELFEVNMNGICPGQSGMEGVELNNFDEIWYNGGAQSVGQYACFVSGLATQSHGLDCHNIQSGGIGMQVQGQLNDYGTYPFCNVIVSSGGSFTSRGAHFCGFSSTYAITVNSGGTWNSDSDYVGVDSIGGGTTNNGAYISAGALATSRNTIFAGTATNLIIFGTFIDQGGNTSPNVNNGSDGSGYIAAPPASARGSQMLFGACTGTATSSATLGLFGWDQILTTTCTSTTTTPGQMMQGSGHLFGLSVSATHVGVSASSGVVTVYKNGSPTAITCTLGTTNSCFDPGTVAGHIIAYSPGDIISVQFTTQGAEVLAGVTAGLFAW